MTRVAAVQHGTRTLLVETDDGVDLLHVTALPRPAQVEPAAEGPAGFATVNRLDNIAKAMPDVQSLIESASGMVIDAVNKLAGKPDKVALEFGIKFAGEGGVPVLTKVSAEAALKLTIEWKPNPQPAPPPSVR